MTSNAELHSIGFQVRDEALKQIMKESMSYFGGMADDWKEYIAGIPFQFAYWTERDPESFEPLVDDLVRTRQALLTEVPEQIGRVKADVREWQGNGADAFEETFLGSIGGVLANQGETAAQLVRALCVVQELVKSSRKDVLEIGRQTLAALEKLDDDKGGGGMGKGWMSVITAVGAGLAIAATAMAVAATGGVAGAALPGLMAWSIRLTVLGAALTTGGAITNELMAAEIKGGTVAEVLTSMHHAMKNLRDYVREQEESLAKALADDASAVDAAMAATDSTALVPPTIAFLYDQDRAGFRPPPAAV